jgi:hypothetical protein
MPGEEVHHDGLDHVSREVLSQTFPVTETKDVKIVSQLNQSKSATTLVKSRCKLDGGYPRRFS